MPYDLSQHSENRANLLPSPDCYLLEEAKGCLLLGDTAGAKKSCTRMAQQLCFKPEVLELRWKIFDSSGEHEQALACASAIIASRRDDPEAWMLQAQSFWKLKLYERCLGVLINAAQRMLVDWRTAMNIVRCQCRLGRNMEARQWFKRALELAEDPVEVTVKAMDDPDFKQLWDSNGQSA